MAGIPSVLSVKNGKELNINLECILDNEIYYSGQRIGVNLGIQPMLISFVMLMC
jgi:hypothetical protein